MQCYAEVYGIEAVGAKVLLSFFLLGAPPGSRQVFAPEVGTAVGVGNIEESNALEGKTVGQVQTDVVALK